MTSDASITSLDSVGALSQSHASLSAGLKKIANGSVKKRASRAGTRSVSTLSATQLERKRANDREAQRAIRQRTKDHIDDLEKTISDLRQVQDSREKILTATRQRNRELEDETSYLRLRLSEAGLGVNLPSSESESGLGAGGRLCL